MLRSIIKQRMRVSAATRAAARFSILRKNSLFPEETQKCGGLVARPACCANCAMASSDSEQNIIEVAAAARPDRADALHWRMFCRITAAQADMSH